MAANYALDFVKSDEDLKLCKLYIIGNNEVLAQSLIYQPTHKFVVTSMLVYFSYFIVFMFSYTFDSMLGEKYKHLASCE